MIKRITRAITLLALLPALLPGCIKEDTSDCIPLYNVSLSFALPAAAGIEGSFTDNIHSVDVLVLDSAGRYLRVERLERAALEAYQGARLYLLPGRYRVTCWGNRAGNTRLEGLELLPAAGAIALADRSGVTAGDCDPLFRSPGFATARAATRAATVNTTAATATTAGTPPTRVTLTGIERSVDGLLTVEVPREGSVEIPAPFFVAHRQVEVQVIGYDHGRSLPGVEIAGLPAGDELVTGLGMLDAASQPLLVTSRKQATAATTGEGAIASFTTFLFPLDDPGIIIRVINPATGDAIFAVPLVEVLDPTTPVATVVIRLVITFRDGNVTVTVNGWEGSEVQPGRK
jgi:hypothetical protein